MSDTLDWSKLEKNGLGDTPEDIQEKCLKLCKDYLGGIWSQQSVDTIQVQRLKGGMLNQLYYCALKDHKSIKVNDDVPLEVAIKLYQEKPFKVPGSDGMERLNELIVSLVLSMHNIGPKLHGVFEGGQILQFYKQKPFTCEEQKDPELVKEVWEKLAQIHCMEIPIKRTVNDFFMKFFEENYNLVIEKKFIDDLIAENKETFVKHDLIAEYDWIKQLIDKTQCPVTFTHKDFRSDNLMVLTDNNNNKGDNTHKRRVVVCDFEFSSYSQRATDFVYLIHEWGHDNAFFERHKVHLPPNDKLLEELFQHYFDECVRILGKKYSQNPINSVKNLIKEYKIYSLLAQFANVLPPVKYLDEEPPEMLKTFYGDLDKDKMIKMAENGYKNYWILKNKLMEDGLFD